MLKQEPELRERFTGFRYPSAKVVMDNVQVMRWGCTVQLKLESGLNFHDGYFTSFQNYLSRTRVNTMLHNFLWHTLSCSPASNLAFGGCSDVDNSGVVTILESNAITSTEWSTA